jgi:hypothetical protein
VCQADFGVLASVAACKAVLKYIVDEDDVEILWSTNRDWPDMIGSSWAEPLTVSATVNGGVVCRSRGVRSTALYFALHCSFN